MVAAVSSTTSTSSSLPQSLVLTPTSHGASVHIYPYGTDLSSLKGSGKTKVLHLIRHAEGYHNVKQDYRNIDNLDARLTSVGIDQCQKLSQRILQAATEASSSKPNSPLVDLLEQTDLIVTSTLTRCKQTTLLSLGEVRRARGDIPIVAHESIRETCNFNCDRRRPISEIRREFPEIDFSHVPVDHDTIWQASVDRLGDDTTYTQHRESAQLHVVAQRGRDFFTWLQARSESHVIVCSHCAFLRCILHYGHGDQVPGQPPQALDERSDKVNRPPVVGYGGFTASTLQEFQADFANCELRSVIVHFPDKA